MRVHVPQAIVAAGDDERAVSVEVNLSRRQTRSEPAAGLTYWTPREPGGQRSGTHRGDGIRVSRQSLETLPRLDVPDANALVELQTDRESESQSGSGGCRRAADGAEAAHRSGHHQVGLRVEVTAEDVVAVTFQSLQALPLQGDASDQSGV